MHKIPKREPHGTRRITDVGRTSIRSVARQWNGMNTVLRTVPALRVDGVRLEVIERHELDGRDVRRFEDHAGGQPSLEGLAPAFDT